MAKEDYVTDSACIFSLYVLLQLYAYINVGCVDVVMVAVHIARDRFQYDPVVIICVPHLI